jgi:hypothetical protein
MKVADLKVIDVVQMPAFEGHVKFLMEDLRKTRKDLELKGAQFKRGPIERLQEKRVYNPKALAALYAKVLDKDIDTTEYPSTLRTFIKGICDEAFHRTVQQIKAEEETKQTIIIKKLEDERRGNTKSD